ncbi:MAG: dNTP triphosphohydrolase [Planctomycetes bacterium]|nr:dNTP triphosphohydrolase [Planctomycetota bacterium]
MPERFDGIQSTARREQLLLAPFAMRSDESRGRRYPEPEHPYRGPFQRDRDRIVHSAAFRRLSGKMQVFTGERGDYHRTRLTHSFEVASIARTIGRSLRLNEDLIEALALFHDIGHPPFGHAGEDALHECLADTGGFSHNRYALTIAEELERPYPDFPGLNLTWEVLEGQAARAGLSRGPTDAGPLLEAQVVEAADSMTYDAHDVDDAVKLGLVTIDALGTVPLVRETIDRIRRHSPRLDGTLLRRAIVHDLIDLQVGDVLDHVARAWAIRPPAGRAEAQRAAFRVGPSADLAERKSELERFLYERVYRHTELARMRSSAQARLARLFAALVREPHHLPPRFQKRIDQVGLPRSVGDYLAGMTDRYCDQQYERFVGSD